jgi:hypothetical protein
MLEEPVVAVGVEQDVEAFVTPLGQVAPPQAQPTLVLDEPALAANENNAAPRLLSSLYGIQGIGFEVEADD